MTSDDTRDAGRTKNDPNDAPGAGPFKGMTVYDADDTGRKPGVGKGRRHFAAQIWMGSVKAFG